MMKKFIPESDKSKVMQFVIEIDERNENEIIALVGRSLPGGCFKLINLIANVKMGDKKL